ncbi:glucose-6-phosphate dehydrogenase [Sunxiuqinia elliptica]|uniref:Glucose-6-phosphate 1-dehydrogenase n=1 Tax=Sunxiuqinia elliptica TaxID=655355 RepID=A0A4R6HBA5_9BACT|nr:glucose-6-phosphate dehydrogenase [Sunxiuqinia elliptica]TDO05287.1 glucose-6-phosphate 1-dehydrogenase [Sunxiuqinia elliptica]TDO64836.1 glucose-6-phosphate 1-dehydrogenase [Sunxiuqinia elliptica]
MKQAESHILVIFGASGDLTKRKLIPALLELEKQNLLPDQFAVLGVSRTELSDEVFRSRMTEFLPKEASSKLIEKFLNRLYYQAISTADAYDYPVLRDRLFTIAKENNIPENFIFYLSTPPSLYEIIPKNLASVALNQADDGFRRLIVEKPFGTDLESAKELNRNLLDYFNEEQIYRIDHYLGKETVQNLLVTRFSNGIFEPIWNHNFIHHIEITSAESLGVENRGGYYDHSGAMRDMVQNHLLQLVGMVAMEPPVIIEADAIRNEVLKVFQSLRPIQEDEVAKYVIRGQYIESHIKGNLVKGYRQEDGVNPESRTETFMAMKFFIDNWRWAGVPFYIRTGKKLPTRVTEVVIHFKKTPHHLFGNQINTEQTANQLVIRIQPDEGILLKFGMKVPGAGFRVQTVNMDFHYDDLANVHLPAAYERLLLDSMQGDATLYSRGDAVEKAWDFVQPIINAWNNNPDIPIYGYPAGTWGPDMVDQLVEDGEWRYPCKNLSNDGTYCEL